ncbi:DUF6232 family protein [Actinoplanes sp. HUAS TT8]|uniref:DUF6232 family protein n=1 Tax=Actinoplanes sp. HUAS TT8 TaxID=3447453 RepID=UPI003F523448
MPSESGTFITFLRALGRVEASRGRKRESTHVRISRNVLWVGSEAYLLSNVAAVRSVEVKPNRGRLVRHYARQGATLVLIAGIVMALFSSARIAGAIVIVGVVVVNAVRLARSLLLPALYILTLMIDGSSRAVMASADRDRIHDLTLRIVDAIENPETEYDTHIDTVAVVSGVGGDKVMGDKFVVDGLG